MPAIKASSLGQESAAPFLGPASPYRGRPPLRDRPLIRSQPEKNNTSKRIPRKMLTIASHLHTISPVLNPYVLLADQAAPCYNTVRIGKRVEKEDSPYGQQG